MSDTVIHVGLRQLGKEGLGRLKAYIEADRPLCLDGEIMTGGIP